MEGGIRVRRLTPDDAALYRAVRLEALEREPNAFLATLDEEVSQPIASFAERLATSAVFGAFQGNEIAGMAGFEMTQGHGLLRGMYVRQSARRSGIGQALVRAVVAHAARQVGTLQLIVSGGNTAAIRFYQVLGFTDCGPAPSAKRHGDEIAMQMTLAKT